MNQLRLEADESAAKVEELQSKVKVLEQENLQKEQEITSLQHKNGILETEVDKLETVVADLKKSAAEGLQHGSQNEALTRRLQLLEEEAEEADKTLREANEKYVLFSIIFETPGCSRNYILTARVTVGSARPTSRPDTLSAKSKPSRPSGITGSPSTRRWLRSTPRSRRSFRTSRTRLATSKWIGVLLGCYA